MAGSLNVPETYMLNNEIFICLSGKRAIVSLGGCVFKNSESMFAEHGRKRETTVVADMAVFIPPGKGVVVSVTQ